MSTWSHSWILESSIRRPIRLKGQYVSQLLQEPNDPADANGNGKGDRRVVLVKNCGAQIIHITTLKTDLCVFYDPYASDLLPVYKISPNFLRGVPHDCSLSCCLSSGLYKKAVEMLKRPIFLYCKQHALINITGLLRLLVTRKFIICGNWHRCKRTTHWWKQWDFTVKIIICCRWESVRSFTLVGNFLLFLHES